MGCHWRASCCPTRDRCPARLRGCVCALGVLEVFGESRDFGFPNGAIGKAAGGNDRARAAAGGALTMRPLGRRVRDRVGQPAPLHHQLLAQRAQFQPEGLDDGMARFPFVCEPRLLLPDAGI